MYLLLFSLLASTPLADAPDTVVVCPAVFRPALEPWIVHRGKQGHRIVFVSNDISPQKIQQAIVRESQSGKLRYVLLVGDVDPTSRFDDPLHRHPVPTHSAPTRTVPTNLVKAEINVRWGSEPHIASDNIYGDLNDDGVPELAVGRLPVDSPAELENLVQRIIAYEKSNDMGPWRRRVNLIAGVGGFGPLVDSLIAKATKKFLTDGIPAPYTVSMTYAGWRSPFCPNPRHFHQATLQRYNEGCLFWVYIGHGRANSLDFLRVPGGVYPIFDTTDVDKLRSPHPAPIALFLSCYAGAFDADQDCLAEEMLRAAGGPVAVLSASRVTMPYAMGVFGNEMIREYFQQRHKTLGDVVMHAKRQTVAQFDSQPRSANAGRKLLDTMAAISSPAEDLQRERAEHLLLFNLLGDPLLKLHHPQTIEIHTEDTIDAGKTLVISGMSPLAGRMTIDIVCRRDRTASVMPLRFRFDSSDVALAKYDQVYQRANDRRWASYSFPSSGGSFEMQCPVPKQAHGPCHVRVFVEGAGEFALGSSNVFVRRYRAAQSRLE